MTTADLNELTFQQIVDRANSAAGRLLRSHMGAHTHEDVVGVLMEKQLKAGKSQSEIHAMLGGPSMYKCLENVKNDIVRWEKAAKRGNGQPSASFDEAEPAFREYLSKRGLGQSPEPFDETEVFFGTNTGNPEAELIRKESDAEMQTLLTHLFEKVELSETQKNIIELDRRGYTNEEIAQVLGIDLDTLYARRSEALRKLAAAAKRMIKHNR